MTRRGIAAFGVLAVIASIMAFGLNRAGAADDSVTIRGVIGGDYTSVGGVVAPDNEDDWGALASLRLAAKTTITDTDVAVVDNQAPTGVVSSDEGEVNCTGTYQNPTAPSDKVCIYISNGHNADNVRGVSIVPGTGGSKWGFKIVWDTPTNQADTFVEAVWAYKKP